MKCVELYAGAGGLAMGVHLAGFKPEAVVELDKAACDTIRLNVEFGFPLVKDWDIREGDVRSVDWGGIGEQIDLLAGGPPCQPFSMGGKHKAQVDKRDMFPSTVQIVRSLRPKAFIIENVKGLTRSSFANYYQYILLQLTFPEVICKPREDWLSHFRRLQREKSSGKSVHGGLSYNVIPTLVNAADYGVPQKRERVFIVGFRSDLGIEWSFPKATHSLDSLIYDQFVSGQYWERHKLKKRPVPNGFAERLRFVANRPKDLLAWRTVRDALMGLPDPSSSAALDVANHRFQDGAKVYAGHTGSPLDLPAKTLKAGDHGVPGGENMMVRDDGSVRYFTVREAARIQTFPDGFRFNGAWSTSMRQLGNAVPVLLGRVVAASVAERLLLQQMNSISRFPVQNVGAA